METIPFNDPYFQLPFILDNKSLKKFYRISMRTCYNLFYNQFYSSLADFEDIFQDSILKLLESINDYTIRNNSDASKLLASIFRNKSIDWVRKLERQRIARKQLRDLLSNEELVLVPIHDSILDIGAVFKDIDNKLSADPKQLTARQHEFYKLYKDAFLQFTNKKEIKLVVMEKMGISENYYGKLKIEIETFIINNTDIDIE